MIDFIHPGDTVRMPWASTELPHETVVPPARAVLYRLAVGPHADRYVPRFLDFEKAGHPLPGWHWPAMLFGAVWAFYRRLWLPGLVFLLLPLAGAAVFAAIEANLPDSPYVWFGCLLLLVWALPALIAAVSADALVYRRSRSLVRRAERVGKGGSGIASMVASQRPTAQLAGLIAGTGAMAAFATLLVPYMQQLHEDHVVRARLAAGLAAIAPLQRQVEAIWQGGRTQALSRTEIAVMLERGGQVIDSVSVNPVNGRLRLALSSALSEFAGKSVLLAPAIDSVQRLFWVCVPVGIAAKHLPRQCRAG